MPSTIAIKHALVRGRTPAARSLKPGELAINIADKRLWVGDALGNPIELHGEGIWKWATGGGGVVHVVTAKPTTGTPGDIYLVV